MTSRTDVCYEMLKTRIHDGVYGSGQRLVIDELQRESHISTNPWREALRRLEAEGWVEIIPNIGARVATFKAGEWARTMRIIARLEGLASALAAQELTAEDIAAARAINRDMEQAVSGFDALRLTDLNKRFHAAICLRSGDEHLGGLLKTEWSRLDLMRRSAFTHAPGRPAGSVVEHDQLLDMYEHHADPSEIEEFARQHTLSILDAVSGADGTEAPASSAK